MKNFLKLIIPPIFILFVRKLNKKNWVRSNLPDKEFYKPLFQPWIGYGEFQGVLDLVEGDSVVTGDRVWILFSLAKQTKGINGDFWECGVYKGGTAAMLALFAAKANKELHLFDTFKGMPETNPKFDYHKKDDFSDNSFNYVKKRFKSFKNVKLHQGLIPKTFEGLNDRKIALAHIDVDIHKSVIDCCEFIYPRMSIGGAMIFDDYGFPSCPGARLAVDEFFRAKSEEPLILPTGQAVVFKLPN